MMPKVSSSGLNETSQRVRVVCDLHRRPWVVADYLRTPGGRWILDAANPTGWRSEVLGTPGRHLVRLDPDDAPTDPATTARRRLTPEPRRLYPNACSFPGCRANTPLRVETLVRVLDGLIALGRPVVTLRELAQCAGRRPA